MRASILSNRAGINSVSY